MIRSMRGALSLPVIVPPMSCGYDQMRVGFHNPAIVVLQGVDCPSDCCSACGQFALDETGQQVVLSVQNRRKSRAGSALENHLENLFGLLGLKCDRTPVTEGKAKPDFLFPGTAAYQDPAFPTELLKSCEKRGFPSVRAPGNSVSNPASPTSNFIDILEYVILGFAAAGVSLG